MIPRSTYSLSMRHAIPVFAVLALLAAGCGKAASSGYNDPAKLARSVEARWNATLNPHRHSGSVPLREHVSGVLCVAAGSAREYDCTGSLYAGAGAAASVVRASERVLVSADGRSWFVRQ